MARKRAALVLATALAAGIAPVALGGAGAVAAQLSSGADAAVDMGTVVQEGGRLTVPAGEEGPVTLRLKLTLPEGVTGPVTTRIGFAGPADTWPGGGTYPYRVAASVVSTVSVNGSAPVPAAWRESDGYAIGNPIMLELPTVQGGGTFTYAVTIDLASAVSWLGSFTSYAQTEDADGNVVARGEAGIDVKTGTYEAGFRGTIHARDKDGVLWRYEGTSWPDKPFKPRKKVGGGWNIYTAIVPITGPFADGYGALVARDKAGVLWYYKGTSNPDAPFAPRVRIGAGWNIYTALAGRGNNTLVARDKDGVLWNYERNYTGTAPFKPRVKVGAGWNTYNTLTGHGGGPLARDTSGVLWAYPESYAADPRVPFKPRVRVGAGWNAYTAVVATPDLGRNDYTDVVARDTGGRLWLYQGALKSGTSVPGPTRTYVGSGWNIYDLIF
ncbi:MULTISPECIES: hypothetical protein [unclassified Streptomyces]|uniref:hypothetical protein n=1 Tax=unclassified Streptomyces TaxID=2593676 RepID=UPI003673CA9E